MQDDRVRLLVAVLAVLLLPLTGCSQKSPEEKVANARSRYYAELNGFLVRQEPQPEAEEAEEAEPPDTAPAGAEEPAPGESEEMPEPVPVRQDVLLDILLRHDSFDKLPGITLDISMADSAGAAKGSWKFYVDTSDLEKGPGRQVEYVLEDVDYQEGDGFYVEVRHPIPENERSEYREFALADQG